MFFGISELDGMDQSLKLRRQRVNSLLVVVPLPAASNYLDSVGCHWTFKPGY